MQTDESAVLSGSKSEIPADEKIRVFTSFTLNDIQENDIVVAVSNYYNSEFFHTAYLIRSKMEYELTRENVTNIIKASNGFIFGDNINFFTRVTRVDIHDTYRQFFNDIYQITPVVDKEGLVNSFEVFVLGLDEVSANYTSLGGWEFISKATGEILVRAFLLSSMHPLQGDQQSLFIFDDDSEDSTAFILYGKDKAISEIVPNFVPILTELHQGISDSMGFDMGLLSKVPDDIGIIDEQNMHPFEVIFSLDNQFSSLFNNDCYTPHLH